MVGLLGCFNREEYAKCTFTLILVVLGVIGYLRINVFYDKDYVTSVSQISNEAFETLLENSKDTVWDKPYKYSEDLIATNDEYQYYRVIDSEYLGYYFSYEDGLFKPKNDLQFIFKIEAVDSKDHSSTTLYL